jgi:hypothetical protein
VDQDKQAVAEDTEGQAAPVLEENSAQDTQKEDDLAELLDEFKQASKPEQTQQSDDTNLVRALQQQVQELQQDRAAEVDQKDFDKVVNAIADGSPLPKTLVAGAVREIAIQDPNIQKAWEARFDNPRAWAKAQELIGEKFKSETENLPDPQVSQDREAVAAAVRGSSKRAPEGPEVDEAKVAAMNDAEFEAWVRTQAK